MGQNAGKVTEKKIQNQYIKLAYVCFF